MGVGSSKTVEEVSAEDIADFVAALGSAFQQYESTLRVSGICGRELANLPDDDCLNVVLDSLGITNRLHRRKLVSVCRKQLQDPNCYATNISIASGYSDDGSIASGKSGYMPYPNTSNSSVGSQGSFIQASSRTAQANTNVYRSSAGDGSVCASRSSGHSKPAMSGAMEMMGLGQAQEALSLLVTMQNQKQLLREADRPSGPPEKKAAIVLTDVQGSTALWEADAVAMRQALNLHDEIIRELRAEHGGYEIDTEGDAFFLAFHSAEDAMKFALSLQEHLREADWSDDILRLKEACECKITHNRGLRVRMGIHMGPVATTKNAVTGRLEYTGPTMDRAREIEGMADGGQILASEETYEAASIAVQTKLTKYEGVVQISCAERNGKRRTSMGSGMGSLNGSNHTITSLASSRRSRRNRRGGMNGNVSSAGSLGSLKSVNSANSMDSVANDSLNSHSLNRQRRKKPTRSQTMPENVEPPLSASQRLAAMC